MFTSQAVLFLIMVVLISLIDIAGVVLFIMGILKKLRKMMITGAMLTVAGLMIFIVLAIITFTVL